MPLWLRGRYGTWAIAFDDERVLTPEGPRYRCRACPELCPRARQRWCSRECKRIWWRAVEAPLSADHLRNRAFARDGRKCVLCGYDDEKAPPVTSDDWDKFTRILEVDHVKPVLLYPELEFDLDNVRVLCQKCHSQNGARPGGKKDKRRRFAAAGSATLEYSFEKDDLPIDAAHEHNPMEFS